MNLSRLKKSRLVELCIKSDLCVKGTIDELKQRLLQTGEHWDLSYVKTKCIIVQDAYSNVKQVSDVNLIPFDIWIRFVQKYSEQEVVVDETLREFFDMGLHYKSVARILQNCYLKK
jgi:hypothetical protein